MAWPSELPAVCPECEEPLVDPYWCGDCDLGPGEPFEGDGYLYHVAPRALHERIASEGLRVGSDPGWGAEQMPGVYLWSSIESAEAWLAISSTAEGTDLEIWEIDGDGLYPLHYDLPGSGICGGAVFTTDPIPARLIEPYSSPARSS